jgi:hypothetical protein
MDDIGLNINVTSEVSSAVDGLNSVTGAGSDMSDALKQIGQDTSDGAGGIDDIGKSAGDFASKAGKTSGALRALSKGFALVGLDGVAQNLQLASQGITAFKGASKGLQLVLDTNLGKFLAQKVGIGTNIVATEAETAATAGAAEAQWSLNAAMDANPVGLIVIALVALVAVFILLFKHSTAFRTAVTTAFHAVQAAALFAFNWIKQNWPLILAIITGPFGLAVFAIVKNWDHIKAGATDVKNWIGTEIGKIPGDLQSIATSIENVLLSPFKAAEDAVTDLINAIKNIKPPHIDLNPFNRTVVAGAGTIAQGQPGSLFRAGGDTYIVNVTGTMIDPDGVAKAVTRAQTRRGRRFGV